MNTSVLDAIRKAGQAMWTVGVMLVGLLRALFGEAADAGDHTDRQLYDSDLTGEYNHRTGRLDAGNDPYGWYDGD